ncbi:MAG: AAA family ATPase [bacterium]|nr:AAA family ATPase [bacterium]
MEFQKAESLEDAWYNFDPDLTLPIPEGQAFYVERGKHSLSRLKSNLLRAKQPKKYFVCGHKGSGKSTELNYLAADEELPKRFKIVHFSLNETCDYTTLTYIDLPVAIALQLREHLDSSLSKGWKEELDQWFMTVTKEIDKEEGYDAQVEAGAKAFLAGFKFKLKTGTTWRSHMKKVIEPKLKHLLELLDHAATEIKSKEKKDLLIIIDNIEKADDAKVKEIIRENYASLMQTDIFIIYTLPISLRGDREIVIPRDQLYSIPCIKYFNKGQRNKFTDGKDLLIEFIDKRMSLDLIEEKAQEEAIRLSGGVFRELARVMQIAIDLVLEADRDKILLEDLVNARHEIVKSYQPMLRPKDYELMYQIAQSNDWLDEVEFMLQHLIVLEYENDSLWLDVRYALLQFLEEKLKENKT